MMARTQCRTPWLVSIALILCANALVMAVDRLPAEHTALFEQKVRPLLAKHCNECHSSQSQQGKGGLLLDSPGGWLKGGDSGEPAVLPGKPDQSLLMRAVRHQVAGLEMPAAKPKLSEAAIADL